jgi:hemerythrin-like domain-containing protein
MTTNSLRRDHDLIEKVLSSMKITISLLKDGKTIPESILLPTIDFTKNFVDVCHHGKEEEILFPALAQTGMPTKMGPIARMLLEHQITKEIASKIEESSKEYISDGNSAKLVHNIEQYIEHVTDHLHKENNRLFMMADARLQSHTEKIEKVLTETENTKLDHLGKTREHYENLVDELGKNIR